MRRNQWAGMGMGCVSCFVWFLLTLPATAQDLPVAKPEEVGVSSTKVEELSTFMQSLVDEGKIAGGVTLMARHGKVIHLRAVGMADREEKKPMTTDAIFRLASMTKPITSLAIMMLYEQGKLGLDDPLSKYIPEFQNPQVLVSLDPLVTEPARREITIRHLLTHTSGLGYSFSEKLSSLYEQHGILSGLSTSELSLEESMKKLAKMPLVLHPGEGWNYGLSTDVLGRVVEVASGTTLDRFITDQICRPLGMHDTFFKVPAEKLPRLAATYVPVEGGVRKLQAGETLRYEMPIGMAMISADYMTAKSNQYLSGGAGLCSTAADYQRFYRMLLGRGELDGVRLLSEETFTLMATSSRDGLSLPAASAEAFNLWTIMVFPSTPEVPEQLRGRYIANGFWSTHSSASPQGDWIVIAMTQLAWDDESSAKWFDRYDEIAAEAIEK